MSKILITGGAGYVGSVLTPYLLNKGHKITVIDLMIYGENVLKEDKNLRKIKGDIRKPDLLETELANHDVIIHFAEGLTVDHISVEGNIAALSLGTKGIALYDVTNPSQPIEKGIFDIGYVYKTQFWGEKLLACSREGLQIITIEQ